MDGPASPVGVPKRQLSTKTYGRAFRQRTSFGGNGGASSSPASSTSRARRKIDDLSSDSNSDDGPSLPDRKGRTGESARFKRTAAVVQPPTRASARRTSSSAQSPAVGVASATSKGVSKAAMSPSNAGPSSRRLSAPSKPASGPSAAIPALPKRAATATGSAVAKRKAIPLALQANAPEVASFATEVAKATAGSPSSGTRGVDRKGKGRAPAAGMDIVLPGPRSSSPASSRSGTPLERQPSTSLRAQKDEQGQATTATAGISSAKRRTMSAAHTSTSEAAERVITAKSTAAAALPKSVPKATSALGAATKPEPQLQSASILQSPKRIRLSSPPAHLKAQTPPGDILQQAEYFAFPSPARNLFGSAPSSPLTPLSSSVAHSSPLRHPLPPSSPSRASRTPQQRLLERGKPTPLTPSSPSARRTPTKAAANLSALFDQHIAGSSTSLSEAQRPAAQSPGEASSSSLTFGSGGVDEEGGNLGKLINLPTRKRRVDQLLQRSNTLPSLAPVNVHGCGSGSSSSSSRTPLGKSISALFPLPLQQEDEPSKSPATIAPWDIKIIPSPPHSRPDSPADDPSPVRSQPQPAKRRTYGGSSRSMLLAIDPLKDGGAADKEERESYAKMAKRWGVDQGGAGLDEGGLVDDTIELTTVTSLRARGENQSFLDDLGYLLDGLQSDELGVRRASSIDLLRKMTMIEFRRNLKTHDQVEGLWELLIAARGKASDMVLDASLLLFLALLAKDSLALEPILVKKGAQCCAFVNDALKADPEADSFALARQGKAGRAKGKDRSGLKMVEELGKLYVDADICGLTPSLRSAASSVLKHMVIESGPRVDTLALLRAAGLTETVARSLRNEIADQPARLRASESAPTLSLHDNAPDFQHVQQCLVVLDGVFARFPDSRESAETAFVDLPALLGTLLTVARVELRGLSQALSSTWAMLCLLSTLRTLVSLSSVSETWSAALLNAPSFLTTLARLIDSSRRSLDTNEGQLDNRQAKGLGVSSPPSDPPSNRPSPVIPTSELDGREEPLEDSAATQLEILCLSLALLSKVVETVRQTKDQVRGTKWTPACSEKGACAVTCHCVNSRPMLLVVAALYEDQRKSSSPEASYLAGYAVLLLAHLMHESPENAAVILPALTLASPANALASTVSDDSSKLEALADELQSFSDVHQRFHEKLSSLAHDADSALANGGLDAESLREIKSGVSALPSKEAGVGEVRDMVGVLRTLAQDRRRQAPAA